MWLCVCVFVCLFVVFVRLFSLGKIILFNCDWNACFELFLCVCVCVCMRMCVCVCVRASERCLS